MADTDTGRSSASAQLPMDRLKDAAQALLTVVTERAVAAAADRVDALSDRLGEVADNGGVGLGSALGGGRALLQGDNPITGAVKGGLSAVKDKAAEAVGLGGGSGGGSGGERGKFKFTNIVEEIDVGVPVRIAYDQWTQFADFPSFMKKVHSVEQEADEKTVWKAQVFWSKRTWNATIIEQVPDSHIIWRSQGVKGYVDGIVSFHELTPTLTRVLLVLEYYPVGFFEKTGNIWRAVGRRARLEFKHYRRHVMVSSLLHQDELEGWRGEIRDSEVVKTHEEALEEEERAAEENGYDEDPYDADDDYDDDYDEYDDTDRGGREHADDADEDDIDEDETDYADEDEADEVDRDEEVVTR
ncbi:SRPBCC family protein [Pseudonocardia sp. C8]|uniref:SRPBCC family protein n=1 Tax=Pseudonocardia sp. C8 TaxID=2762759 RepID=UPI0016435CF8|nr:SRPBCC family protein [Pseudonocardia sp. C8]MBC3191399.1 SRPBCC family protein [Pseudonocardia sp. C8]